MRFIRQSSKYLAGKWMQRLVWYPSILVSMFLLGVFAQREWGTPLFSSAKQINSALVLRNLDAPARVLNATPRAVPIPSNLPSTYSVASKSVSPTYTQVNIQHESPSQTYSSLAPSSTFAPSTTYSPPSALPNQPIYAQPFPQQAGSGSAYHPTPQPYVSPAYPTVPNFNPGFGTHETAQQDPLMEICQSIRALDGSDPAKLRESISGLLDLAVKQFDEKQTHERSEITAAKERLATWEEAIKQRDTLKKTLIESYLARRLESPDPMSWTFSGTEFLNPKPAKGNLPELFKQLWSEKEMENAPRQSEPVSFDEKGPENAVPIEAVAPTSYSSPVRPTQLLTVTPRTIIEEKVDEQETVIDR